MSQDKMDFGFGDEISSKIHLFCWIQDKTELILQQQKQPFDRAMCPCNEKFLMNPNYLDKSYCTYPMLVVSA